MRSNISQTQNRFYEWTIQTDLPREEVQASIPAKKPSAESVQVFPNHYADTQVWLTNVVFNLGKYIIDFLPKLGGIFLLNEKDNKKDSRFKFFGLCVLAFFALRPNSNFKLGALFPFVKQTETTEVKENRSAKKISMDLSGDNIYAPVSASSLEEQKVIDFIKQYAPTAVREMHTYKIPASIKMAQALIESRAGRSKLAVNNNNHFGMKCFSRRCNKNHCTNATDDHHKDFFRKFDTPMDSWKAHSQLISQGRYKSLQNHKLDYKKWATGLKAAGYATDKKYASKLINIIDKYQLHQLDKFTS